MLHVLACGGVGQLLKQVQMLWQKIEMCFMILAVLMLACSIFCLETLPNGKSVQSGRLIIGSSRTTSPNKDHLKMLRDKYVGDSNGSQSDQPALIGKYNSSCDTRYFVLMLILV